MPAKRRLTMRQLRQMLRLAGDGRSSRDIAVTLGVARSTVQDNLKRAAAAGLSWPLPGELTDDAIWMLENMNTPIDSLIPALDQEQPGA